MARTFTGSTSVYGSCTSTPITGYPLTMSAWIYPTLGTGQTFCSIGATGATSYFYIGMNTSGYVGAYSSLAGSPRVASCATKPTGSVWSHVCGVFANATSRSMFLNGGYKSTDTYSQTPTGLGYIGIGINYYSTSHVTPMNGRLAEVVFWNIDLADAEVAALATGIHPRKIQPSAIVGYWPLWGLSSPEPDISSGGRSITLTGTPAASNHAPIELFTKYAPTPSDTGIVAQTIARRVFSGRFGSRSILGTVNT